MKNIIFGFIVNDNVKNMFNMGDKFIMIKRIFIVGGFVVLAICAISVLYMMNNKSIQKVVNTVNETKQEISIDKEFVYNKGELKEECIKDDMIFCAIEKVVKCTINPDMNVCNKDSIPSFVLGKVEDDIRPNKIGFNIVKIKPVEGSRDVNVYTKSQCDASWFGLCNGTVIYLLSPSNESWRVVNIYAIEE